MADLANNGLPLRELICLGVDPGIKGGLAIISSTQGILSTLPMPIVGKTVDAKSVIRLLTMYQPDIAVVEEVHAMPGQGVTSMFQFGKMYGGILSLVMSTTAQVYTIRPQEWKKYVLLGTTKDKQAAIDYCTERYPSINLIQPRCKNPHDGIADAICLADYGLYHLTKGIKQ